MDIVIGKQAYTGRMQPMRLSVYDDNAESLFIEKQKFMTKKYNPQKGEYDWYVVDTARDVQTEMMEHMKNDWYKNGQKNEILSHNEYSFEKTRTFLAEELGFDDDISSFLAEYLENCEKTAKIGLCVMDKEFDLLKQHFNIDANIQDNINSYEILYSQSFSLDSRQQYGMVLQMNGEKDDYFLVRDTLYDTRTLLKNIDSFQSILEHRWDSPLIKSFFTHAGFDNNFIRNACPFGNQGVKALMTIMQRSIDDQKVERWLFDVAKIPYFGDIFTNQKNGMQENLNAYLNNEITLEQSLLGASLGFKTSIDDIKDISKNMNVDEFLSKKIYYQMRDLKNDYIDGNAFDVARPISGISDEELIIRVLKNENLKNCDDKVGIKTLIQAEAFADFVEKGLCKQEDLDSLNLSLPIDKKDFANIRFNPLTVPVGISETLSRIKAFERLSREYFKFDFNGCVGNIMDVLMENKFTVQQAEEYYLNSMFEILKENAPDVKDAFKDFSEMCNTDSRAWDWIEKNPFRINKNINASFSYKLRDAVYDLSHDKNLHLADFEARQRLIRKVVESKCQEHELPRMIESIKQDIQQERAMFGYRCKLISKTCGIEWNEAKQLMNENKLAVLSKKEFGNWLNNKKQEIAKEQNYDEQEHGFDH